MPHPASSVLGERGRGNRPPCRDSAARQRLLSGDAWPLPGEERFLQASRASLPRAGQAIVDPGIVWPFSPGEPQHLACSHSGRSGNRSGGRRESVLALDRPRRGPVSPGAGQSTPGSGPARRLRCSPGVGSRHRRDTSMPRRVRPEPRGHRTLPGRRRGPRGSIGSSEIQLARGIGSWGVDEERHECVKRETRRESLSCTVPRLWLPEGHQTAIPFASPASRSKILGLDRLACQASKG